MISKTIFRQYDIRGIVNEDLTCENSKLIGYFLGLKIKKIQEDVHIIVGYDIRTHSKTLFNGLISGINLSGCKVLNIGLVATGVNYFASYQEFMIDMLIPCHRVISNDKTLGGYNGGIEKKEYLLNLEQNDK